MIKLRDVETGAVSLDYLVVPNHNHKRPNKREAEESLRPNRRNKRKVRCQHMSWNLAKLTEDFGLQNCERIQSRFQPHLWSFGTAALGN